MLTFEAFKEYCNKIACLRHTIRSKRCATESKQKACYKKYIKLQKKHLEKLKDVDEQWEIVKKRIWERDKGTCRLMSILTTEEFTQLNTITNDNYPKDVAHVISRAQAPTEDLYYNEDNLVLMFRVFHSRLDQYQHPVTGMSITRQERKDWWIRIIGQRKWNKLQKLCQSPSAKAEGLSRETQE